jgi:hypothetical protein
MAALTSLFLASLLAGAAAAAVISDADGLRQALAALGTPGPPVVLQLAGNFSLDRAMPRGRPPARIARSTTLRGGAAGAPAATELSLSGWVDAWQLDPGVTLTLQNLTLSNLALRPPDAPPPPPANVSGARTPRAAAAAAAARPAAMGLRRRAAPSHAAGGGAAAPPPARAPPQRKQQPAATTPTLPQLRSPVASRLPRRASPSPPPPPLPPPVFTFPLWFFKTDR